MTNFHLKWLQIVNEGPADIKSAKLYLYWPLRYADGSFDLSLMDLKHSNQIQCPSNLYVDKEEAESDKVMVPKQEDDKIAYYVSDNYLLNFYSSCLDWCS